MSRHLIGRDGEVVALMDHLTAGVSLINVTGPVGVGKSTLIRDAYAQVHEKWSAEGTRAVFSDATDCADVDALVAEVARAARATEVATVEGLAQVLGAGPAIVFIDNFEHLISAAVGFVDALLSGCPELQVVVASRVRLQRSAEQLVELAPLAPPPGDEPSGPAAALFEASLRALSDSLAEQVLADARTPSLLRALDGLPLAIELAAARCRVLSVESLCNRLETDESALDDAENATSLTRCIEVSWDLSNPKERAALARLSVFRGSFDAESAQAAFDVALPTLQALRDQCWLVGPEPGNLRLLFVLRRFVERQPIYGELLPDSRQRHLEWAADRAAIVESDLRGSNPGPSCAWMRRHADNLRAAERLGARQEDPVMRASAARVLSAELAYCQIVGGAGRLATEIDAVLAHDGLAHAPPLAARLGCHRARLSMRDGDLSRAREELERADGLSHHLDPPDRAATVVARAHLDALAGKHVEALAALEAHLEHARENQDETSELALREALVDVTRQSGRFAKGREHGERALELLGPKRSLAHAPLLTALSFIASESGSASAAAAFAERGLSILDELGVDRTRTRIGLELARARAFHLDGEVEQAAEGCERSRQYALVNGDSDLVGYAELARASALLELRRTAEARELFASAVVRLRAPNPYAAVGSALLSACEALLGDAEEAERHMSALESALAPSIPPPFAKIVRVTKAAVQYVARRDGDAEAILRELVDSAAPRKGGAPMELRALRAVAMQALLESARDPVSPRLILGPEARWYRVDDHPVVACTRRPVMRRILCALADAWADRTGVSLSKEALREAGWPKERMRAASAQRRLEVMISRMRQLGLRSVLETTERGYRLRPDCEVLNDGRHSPK